MSASSTIRVIHFPEQGRAEITTDPMPACGPAQLLVRAEYTGISNGTERSFLVGGPYGNSSWPCRCGYQTVGRVIEVGSDVTGYAVGDRVFAGNFRHHAEVLAVNIPGPDHHHHLTARLPDAIDPTHAALFGVAAVSFHDVRRCGVKPGDRVLVVGAGLIGQFAAQAALIAGADVTLCSRGSDRLRIADRCGIRHTQAIPDDSAWSTLRGKGFDVCVEDSGADILHHLIGDGPGNPGVLRYGGKLFICAGRHEVTYRCLPAQSQGLEFLHATHFHRTDLLHLVEQAAAGRVCVGPLLRDVVPVDEAPAIYAKLRDEPRSLLGTVFRWS